MKGFTLIETLVAIAVFVIALGAVFGAVVIIYRFHGYTWQQSSAIEEARRGIEIMIKEIRAAKPGDDGSYSIVKAEDKEFIFFSDITGDGKTERVRYFLGTVASGSKTEECETFLKGGSCGVSFSNFLQGNLISAQVKVSVNGDFGHKQEYADIYADGVKLGDVCKGPHSQTGCTDCPGDWQGTRIFDITQQAADNSIYFLADASKDVGTVLCPHAMKVRFEFFWTEDLADLAHEFKKGVIKPVIGPGGRIIYPADQEEIFTITSFVRNSPPIFKYFDAESNEIEEYPARLIDTKLMQVYLVVNIDPNRPPQDFELKTYVQLRNLKQE